MKPFCLPPKQLSKTNPQFLKSFGNDGSVKNDLRSTTHEYVTEFDSSKTPLEYEQEYRQGDLAVHAKQNGSMRPERKMKNIDLPLRAASSADSGLCFEVESPSMVQNGADAHSSFGLNLRKKPNGSSDIVCDSSVTTGVDALILQKFKDDLRTLPEDRGLAEFDALPVHDFSKTIFAGLGWSEGGGTGKNPKTDVEAFKIKKRSAMEGIGYSADIPHSKHKTQKSRVSNGQPNWISVGKDVRVISGSEVGLKGKIIDLPVADSKASLVTLRLCNRNKNVNVHIHEIAELGSTEETNCLSIPNQSAREQDRGSNRERKRQRDDTRHKDGTKVESIREVKNTTPISWLYSNIRVKIISKDFKGGRLYLKKGEVMDVVGATTCDVIMDDRREVVQGVDQEDLETVLPHHGGCVLVLYGTHQGVLGSLEVKDLDADIGVVRAMDTHELLKVRLEEIAEYVGDPSLLHY